MPADTSEILGLPYIQPAQAQKHVTHNEALRQLDVIVQLSVLSQTISTPPAAPTAGDRYIVPTGAGGAWGGEDGKIAVSEAGGWAFFAPLAGWSAYVADIATQVTFDGSSWQSAGFGGGDLQNVSLLGVGTTAAAPNKLAVASDATLLSHDGADHRVAINKAASADTASVLFQSGFTGHAEMGLTGSDGFDIRVSPDGSTFTTALDIDPVTAVPAMPQGLSVSGALTGSGIVGSVSETGGVSDGAVIERGSNTNGEYVLFADGTQICTRTVLFTGLACTTPLGALFHTDTLGSFAFPKSFVQVGYVDAALSRTEDATLRTNAVSARLRLSSPTDPSLWRQLVLISAASVTTAAAEETEFTLIAVGRWY